MTKQAKVFLIDDHPAMRRGIAQLISDEADLEVCGEAADRQSAMDALARVSPDLAIVDIALQGSDHSGLDLIVEIHAAWPDLPLLAYSMHDERNFAERALRAGARGYLMKQEPVRQLIDAIHHILAGGVFVSEAMNRRLLLLHVGKNPDRRDSLPAQPQDLLTGREFEIFRLIGSGLPPREIGRQLCLSVKTIETHRMNIRKKLGLANAFELTRHAVQWVHGNCATT